VLGELERRGNGAGLSVGKYVRRLCEQDTGVAAAMAIGRPPGNGEEKARPAVRRGRRHRPRRKDNPMDFESRIAVLEKQVAWLSSQLQATERWCEQLEGLIRGKEQAKKEGEAPPITRDLFGSEANAYAR